MVSSGECECTFIEVPCTEVTRVIESLPIASASSAVDACTAYGTPANRTNIYYHEPPSWTVTGSLRNGIRYYSDSAGATPYAGQDLYFTDGTRVGTISDSGVFLKKGEC